MSGFSWYSLSLYTVTLISMSNGKGGNKLACLAGPCASAVEVDLDLTVDWPCCQCLLLVLSRVPFSSLVAGLPWVRVQLWQNQSFAVDAY